MSASVRLILWSQRSWSLTARLARRKLLIRFAVRMVIPNGIVRMTRALVAPRSKVCLPSCPLLLDSHPTSLTLFLPRRGAAPTFRSATSARFILDTVPGHLPSISPAKVSFHRAVRPAAVQPQDRFATRMSAHQLTFSHQHVRSIRTVSAEFIQIGEPTGTSRMGFVRPTNGDFDWPADLLAQSFPVRPQS